MHPLLTQYLAFLLQAVTVVVAVGVLAAIIAAAFGRRRAGSGAGRLEVRKLNDTWRAMSDAIADATLTPKQLKTERKQRGKSRKKSGSEHERRVFVIDFVGDVRANRVAALRQEVTAVLGAANADDEVIVRVDSGGGAVSGYGLAAAQLERLRAADIPLTVTIDKVAASGGYMMAVVANRIVCAPFAVVGSIGVVAQMPNLHRWLKKRDVDLELITAGKHKRTLTIFGENTEEGRAKFQAEMDSIHASFQALVARYRPSLDVDVVATGEWWLGSAGIGLGLVDELGTSDDVLLNAGKNAAVLAVQWRAQVGMAARFGGAVRALVTDGVDAFVEATRDDRTL